MSDINMTPLIDVMLVLLVIFIITAPLLANSIKLELPKAAGAAAVTAQSHVVLNLDAAGRVYLDEVPLDLGSLAQRLKGIAQRDAQTEVRLRADAGVPYGQVVVVMGLAHQAGLRRIGFVAEAPGGVAPGDALKP